MSNNRIAKNTLFLYFRLLLLLLVSLYTVRVVLNALGAEDYGIYNVVGGVVTILSFFTSTMTSASQRFFAFELGRKDYVKLGQYFNLSVITYLGFIFFVLIIAETIGIWFLENKLVIPGYRQNAAHWVYQLTIISFIISMIVVPYNSIIIARERMDVYAYVSIVEAVVKLLAVYVLVVVKADKLVLYSILQLCVTSIVSVIYICYSVKNYPESRLNFFWDTEMFKKLIKYSSWSLFGALSSMIKGQGINILLNIFFNPVVNAARAIAFQVNSAISLFIHNFYQAVRPQITKHYAAGNIDGMINLVATSSRFSYYLIMIFGITILTETSYILHLWLGDVPHNTILFTRLVVITAMFESISYPLMTAVSATGNIKWYQIITGGLMILNLPISYLFLSYGYPPEITMYIAMFLAVLSQVSRIYFVRRMFGMSFKDYFNKIVLVITLVTILSWIIPFIVSSLMIESTIRFILVAVATCLFSVIVVYIIGINRLERDLLLNFIKKRFISKDSSDRFK